MRRLAAVTLVVVIAACGAPAPAATTAPTAAPGATRPAFLTYAFTNVRDGSKFTLSDFAGKSVLVIGMAVW